ncbi:dTDP-4-dehydrorhamnose 3,5-epimerase [Candidatus Terasakiella magnetica]|uniref:dTDP-4-dehydrorhamnose 3,5-epimerase n=1 Tax=Candidatus Terasakiella magnetica TaxID=1867952 RepID=A0A1C3RKR6_9PROT|nr:dTDP-4-dehydrorhamnose 3,5-epimerase family protein [Candidatus Terasakiella magnetica]SCA57853.1 dTDP-4-dehydrorhamnose 3,5-epimerase [Candidatus Terasakiella magnetica]
MKVEETKLDGVLKITPPTIFEDFRGEYIETYNERLYHEAGIDQPFIQDDISVSSQHVLRGIHGDAETWKLISCLHGKFYILVINWDKDSPQFGQWEGHTLSAKNRHQLLIPPKHGNGHVVLTDEAIFHYKQTSEYNRAGQFTLLWNDPKLDLYWPINNPIVSPRDSDAQYLT